MEQQLKCPTCEAPLEATKLAETGVVSCEVCRSRFATQSLTQLALTYVDDFPTEEYSGG